MAEFLIKAVDQYNADPLKDQRGCYKRGDIVQVYEDGACKEPPAPNSKFVIVKIPGLSKATAEQYAKPDEEIIGEEVKVNRRRLYNVDFTALPKTIIDKLKADREITVTLSQVRNYIKNKTTNLSI